MNIERMCTQWHNQLLPQFICNITENVKVRLMHINHIIQTNFPPHFDRFEINSAVQNDVMKKIKPQIIEKTKVEHKSCSKPPKSLKEYKIVARNRLNRNKPKFFGNYLFAEIIFNQLYPFIYEQSRCNINAMQLFVKILIQLFESKVHFTQTKPQPLILNTTLVNENLFKTACLKLLKLYQISPININSNAKKSEQKYLRIVTAIKQIDNFDILSRLPTIPNIILTINDQIPILSPPTTTIVDINNDNNNDNNNNDNNNDNNHDYNNIYMSASCTIAVISPIHSPTNCISAQRYTPIHSSTNYVSAQRYSPTWSLCYNGLCYNDLCYNNGLI